MVEFKARIVSQSPLSDVVTAQKQGMARGITSVCSANTLVIEATLQHARTTGEPVLVESTCNQVNQFGGYTGWNPAGFIAFLEGVARRLDFPLDQITVGGDHLGPSPWQHEPATMALAKGQALVRECVLAGYRKIHLDASMRCADDEPSLPLDVKVAAGRAADLALAAEAAVAERPTTGAGPSYVIGTEVPLPGGAQDHEAFLAVSDPAAVAETIETTRRAFLQRGLEPAWERVIAVVVQPGVEFGDSNLFEYDRAEAAGLTRLIEGYDQLVYEAHSTDYQAAGALRQLVEDHFAILKVGPALTYALREGIFALAAIEEELLAGQPAAAVSRIREKLDEVMLANPVYWQKYYAGDAHTQWLARRYSFSDRSRYYWPLPAVQQALSRLIGNLEGRPLPLTLLSQYLPQQYRRIRSGELNNTPQAILLNKVGQVLSDYSFACGHL